MRKAARAKAIIESAVPVPLDNIEDQGSLSLGRRDGLGPSNEETFDICPVSSPEDTPEEPEPLNEEELGEIRFFKCKLTAYKKSFPGKFNDLNWSALNSDNIEEIEELYNKVVLTFNHGYQKSAGMVGVAYQTAMSGLEGAAKMTGGLVLLDGLSVATAKNEEIKDILTQINIETGCYDSVQSPKLRLVVATLNTAVQVHLLNTQLRSNPELVERLRQQQLPPVQNLRDQYSDL